VKKTILIFFSWTDDDALPEGVDKGLKLGGQKEKDETPAAPVASK
jgi:hypothetical protein